MGVISLLGDGQAREIERLLLDRLGPEEVEKRQLLCGDAYAFQGTERDVMFFELAKRGYRVLPQYQFAGYFIDLLVEGMRGRLAVECDGDAWHGADRYHQDMARQRMLQRCGLRFWRVRGSTFTRDPNSALQELWEILAQERIFPRHMESNERSVVVSESAHGISTPDAPVANEPLAPADHQEDGLESEIPDEGPRLDEQDDESADDPHRGTVLGLESEIRRSFQPYSQWSPR